VGRAGAKLHEAALYRGGAPCDPGAGGAAADEYAVAAAGFRHILLQAALR
jgi:hypothetical protein